MRAPRPATASANVAATPKPAPAKCSSALLSRAFLRKLTGKAQCNCAGRGESMQIREITPGFGAEITGVDLNQPLSPETEADLVSAIATYGVCVYPDTHLTDQTHVWFSRIFGNLWTTPAASKMKLWFEIGSAACREI